MGLASAQQGFIRARSKDDPLIPPLPDEWKEDTDQCTGISFYYNDETGKRTWVRPGFIPPPPGGGGGGPRPHGGNRGGHMGGNNRGGPPMNNYHNNNNFNNRGNYGGGGGGGGNFYQ